MVRPPSGGSAPLIYKGFIRSMSGVLDSTAPDEEYYQIYRYTDARKFCAI